MLKIMLDNNLNLFLIIKLLVAIINRYFEINTYYIIIKIVKLKIMNMTFYTSNFIIKF
jgi:hypothetical protein